MIEKKGEDIRTLGKALSGHRNVDKAWKATSQICVTEMLEVQAKEFQQEMEHLRKKLQKMPKWGQNRANP